MNIYLVQRTDDIAYDQYIGFVIAAETADIARSMAADIACQWSGMRTVWTSEADCDLIGTSPDGEQRIIMESHYGS